MWVRWSSVRRHLSALAEGSLRKHHVSGGSPPEVWHCTRSAAGFEVADQVVVMNEGKIVQVGSPNPFVFNFLGRVVTFQGRVRAGRLILGDAIYEVPEHGAVPDSPATVYVRPQDIRVASTASNLPTIRAVVRRVNRAGPYIYLDLERQLDGNLPAKCRQISRCLTPHKSTASPD
jgi:ABC-type sulfate/molybdate transport systems ATPase subunit